MTGWSLASGIKPPIAHLTLAQPLAPALSQ